MQIFVNGKAHDVDAETTISGLIAALGLGGGPVAVERNREVVPRARHASTLLAPGDRLEVVTFVGGG